MASLPFLCDAGIAALDRDGAELHCPNEVGAAFGGLRLVHESLTATWIGGAVSLLPVSLAAGEGRRLPPA